MTVILYVIWVRDMATIVNVCTLDSSCNTQPKYSYMYTLISLYQYTLHMLTTCSPLSFPNPSRIRRAGYPVRHTFQQFVERYRILLPGLLLQDVVDFKQTSRRICARVMQDKRDWQIGYNKVFLKVSSMVCICSVQMCNLAG